MSNISTSLSPEHNDFKKKPLRYISEVNKYMGENPRLLSNFKAIFKIEAGIK